MQTTRGLFSFLGEKLYRYRRMPGGQGYFTRIILRSMAAELPDAPTARNRAT